MGPDHHGQQLAVGAVGGRGDGELLAVLALRQAARLLADDLLESGRGLRAGGEGWAPAIRPARSIDR